LILALAFNAAFCHDPMFEAWETGLSQQGEFSGTQSPYQDCYATMPGERRVNREAKMNDLARQLLTSEAKNPASSEELAYATERICRELLRYLSRILGRDGSLTLLRRSLKQAQNKFSLLRSVETDADGGLKGFSQSLQGQESATLEIGVAVIESLLALLASLVGEDLAKALVEDALINPRDAEATNTGNKL
jgi:hypothetical protein